VKPRLSVAVMAVPERASRVAGLQRKMGRSAPVSWDHEHRGPWWNSRQAWRMVKGGATHHLVIQDDMTVCQDFIASVEAALTVVPLNPVGLYANRKEVEQAKVQDKSWVKVKYFLWGTATVLPIWLIPRYLQWSKSNVLDEFHHDDFRFGMFCESQRLDCFCTVPSLTDHEADKESIVGNRSPLPRVARWYIGDDQSGLTVDWNKGLDDAPTVNYGSLLSKYSKWLV
jgi:hypothetical protein